MLDVRRSKNLNILPPTGWLARAKNLRLYVPNLPRTSKVEQPLQGLPDPPLRQGSWALFLKTALAFLPAIFAVVYFAIIASDRYVSEAKFVVRTATKPNGLAGLGSFLQMTGLARSQDDVFSVQDFMTSRDALRQLNEKVSITAIYGRPEADFLTRYPSIFYGVTIEQFHRYFQWMLTVSFSSATGITTLRVEAFRPEDAEAVAFALLSLGEQMVNRMNERIQNDAVRMASEEVRRNEQRLVAAQIAITNFRNQELMIDPARSSLIVTELIARLDSELSQTKAKLTETTAASPGGPQIGVLQRHVAALEGQILKERGRISDESTGLASKLAEYEKFILERDFAKQSLSAASVSLDTARIEARRQQLYLERVVEPNLADYPMMPQRTRMVATAFGMNVLGLIVIWLIFAGVREHAGAEVRIGPALRTKR